MTTTTGAAELRHDIGVSGSIRVRQAAGSIIVRGVDGTTARVVDRDGRPLAETFRVETGDGRLSLTTPDRLGLGLIVGFGRGHAPDLELDVPRGAVVTIETASAGVRTVGLVGRTSVRSASGDIVFETGAGSAEIETMSGEVAIDARGVLALRCRTVSGDVAVRAPRLERAEIATTSGDVRLDARLEGAGPFSIDTVSGDATIVGRSGLRIEGRTVSGGLRSEVEHRLDVGPGRRRLVFGDGSTALTFNAISGDLRVVAPRDHLGDEPAAAPAPPAVPAAAPSAPEAPADPIDGGREVARLDVLKAVERGDLSVDAAIARLARIEEA